MLVIPAIDIRKGQCVRLKQGRMEEETIFSRDPVFIAKLWKAQGASSLHIVDLDGAFTGVVQNLSLIKDIKREVQIPVTVGGGIRDFETIKRVFADKIDSIVLGTTAIYNPELVKKAVKRYKDRIIVAIDAVKGNVAIGGWKDVTTVKARDLAKKMESIGVKRLLFTDIRKDGMLSGPNLKATREFAEAVQIPVIASGGISSLDDIREIKKLEPYGVEGVIIGRALYTEAIKLDEAIKVVGE